MRELNARGFLRAGGGLGGIGGRKGGLEVPRGRKEIAEAGKNTRFSGSRAVDAAHKSKEVQQANKPLKLCLRGIATQALYGKPPLPEKQLQPIAEFFNIGMDEVTFAHLAIYKQSIEMAKGDISSLNLVAAYAGEKPADKVEVATPDYSALEEARRELLK